ncbi:MAG: hypothetical protein ACI4RG_12565 [Huintestinicola sp.]
MLSRGEDKCTHVTTLIAPINGAAQSAINQQQFSVTGEARCRLIGKSLSAAKLRGDGRLPLKPPARTKRRLSDDFLRALRPRQRICNISDTFIIA